jgi:hypothetical protein
MIRRAVLGGVGLALAIVAPPEPAAAQSPAYVGTWAVRASQCGVGQDKQNAPLVMGRRGYDQHEAHCSFTSVRQQGAGWRVQASCSVEGDKQKHAFTLSVAGDRLTLREDGLRAVTYRRCK